jgi:hypothetical protein
MERSFVIAGADFRLSIVDCRLEDGTEADFRPLPSIDNRQSKIDNHKQPPPLWQGRRSV